MKKKIKIPYDYSALEKLIKSVYGTISAFGKAMNLSERTMSLKMNSLIPWTQPEMEEAAELLGFPKADIQIYFFTLKVQ